MNPHVSCPRFQGETFMLRLVTMEDAPALLRVYSDEAAWPLFNSDNCHGDLFRYTTVERMREAIAFWLASYREGWFVRWAVVAEGAAVGTVEMFRRRAEDAYDGRGILRVDLGSAWERPECIREIVELLLPLLAVELKLPKDWNYSSLYLAILETAARHCKVHRYRVYTVQQLLEETKRKIGENGIPEGMPDCVQLILDVKSGDEEEET